MVAPRRPPLFGLLASMAVVAVALVVAPRTAAADDDADPAAVAKVTNLNKKALDAYGKENYKAARDLLKQALDLCGTAGLDQHPITARTHIHMGVVAIVGFKQHDLGIKQFRKALEIEPDIKLTKSLVTPELEDAFGEASSPAKTASADEGGGDEKKRAAGSDEDKSGEDKGDDDKGGESAEGDDDNPAPKKAKARKKKSDDEDQGDADKGGDEGGAAGAGSFYLALTLGSGAGIASGSGHLNPAHKLSGPGFAVGQLGQIEPQVGYFATPTLLVSLVLRLQLVSGLSVQETGCGAGGTSVCNPTTMAAAVLARGTWILTEGSLHFTAGGQIGGGYVVHAVAFPLNASKYPPCGVKMNSSCVDALVGGPFLIGPTAGLLYDLTDTFDLVLGVNTEIGVPKFTFNFDVDFGLAVRL